METINEFQNSVIRQNIAIVTTCIDDWGGCDELWSKCIPYLRDANFTVSVFKKKINCSHPKFAALMEQGISLIALEDEPVHFKKKQLGRLRMIYRLIFRPKKQPGLVKPTPEELYILAHPFTRKILPAKPCLVIISQSLNFDGTDIAFICYRQQIPYVIVSHKAVDFFWPESADRNNMKIAFQQALHCFFVSKHNLQLTEEQFGMRFNNASVIFNPVKVRNYVPYPDMKKGLRLACMGRLMLLDKGQDILLRVIAQEKWKERDIRISFIGEGADEVGLKEMADLLNLPNVDFTGVVNDFEWICQNHHAFIMPSRSEGLPLVIVEAMASGRMVVATNAGGNAELILEGLTGYICDVNEASLDDAMERAWRNRDNWELMGVAAAAYVKTNIPECPEAEFADTIISFMK